MYMLCVYIYTCIHIRPYVRTNIPNYTTVDHWVLISYNRGGGLGFDRSLLGSPYLLGLCMYHNHNGAWVPVGELAALVLAIYAA